MPPINGMTSAASALRYWERRQEVVANNLANVSTTGFKGERVFASLVNGAETAIGTTTDRRAGAVRATGEAFDVAVAGEGFLVVDTPAGERWTRGGSLALDREGFLTDATGARVQGEGGDIQVGRATLEILRDGTVKLDGHAAGKLRLEHAPADAALVHEGGTRFVPPDAREPVGDDARELRQGALEESNVESLGTLVDMVSVQRAYAAIEKTVSVLDHARETATTQLGKPV